MEIVINPTYECLRDYINAVPMTFDTEGNGVVMRNGRNIVKHVDKQYVIKKFVRVTLINRIVYSFFRKTKAKRAFENSMKLKKHNVNTPEAIAYIEIKKLGVLQDCYYIYRYSNYSQLSETLDKVEVSDKDLIDQFAEFVVTLHLNHIFHNDLNPSNVLYKRDPSTGKIDFQLIDINRIRFKQKGQSYDYYLRNLARIVDSNSWSVYFMNRYERYMGYPMHYVSKKCEYYNVIREIERDFRHLIRDMVLLRL